MTATSFEQFNSLYQTMPLVPVSMDILGDLDTPVSTFLKTTSGPYRFLLESVEGGARQGRYSIIGDTPIVVFNAKNGCSTLFNSRDGEEKAEGNNPLSVLQNLLQQYVHPAINDIPFINGGLFGFLGYDTIRYIENLPEQSTDDTLLPDILLFIPQKIIVFDNLLHKITLIFFVQPEGDAYADYRRATNELKAIAKKFHSHQKTAAAIEQHSSNGQYKSNLSKPAFEQIVARAKKHIKRGDTFQIVLSQRLELETSAQAFDVYRGLRVINPSPYMFYMEMDDVILLGSSPETLVKLEGETVYLKPIAGTRKRGANESEDDALIKDLLADPKELAEHTMLVDLGRNDVGRVAQFGTIKVDELMSIEKYSHVIHIVSTVSGKLRQGLDAVDVFKACFPAGTVSGAPKVRAMEIIEELEPTRRGIYAGAAGYFAFNGNMDVCIAIRTLFIKNGKLYVQAGAGIVADSVPDREYEETLNKARGLLKAVEYAEGGFYDRSNR
jgi:anthranilate synthase component 1